MRAPAFTSPLEASIYVEGLRARPAFFVAALLLAHAAIWTFTSWIANPTPDPQLAIGLALGREWQLGYVDAPPLAPWILEIAYRTGGLAAAYALGPLSVALAGWLVFAFARRIAGDRHGALAVFLMVGVHPVAFPIGAFDSDLVQMPLVALAVLVWWHAVTDKSRVAWITFGLTLAALAYSGAQGLFVLATLVLLLAANPAVRSLVRTQEGAITVVLALFMFTLLLTPRLIWLQNHGFAGAVPSADLRLDDPSSAGAVAIAVAVAFGHIGLVLLIVLASRLKAPDRDIAPVFMRPPLERLGKGSAIALALLPPLFALATAYFMDARLPISAATPLLLYSGLLAVVLGANALRVHRQRTVAVAGLTLLLLPPAMELATSFASPWFGDTGRATNWPARDASRFVTDVYRTRTSRQLEYVVGDITTASSIALLSRDRPHVFIDADPARAPWADQEKIEAAGAVVVWRIVGADAAPPAALAANLPPLVAEAPLTLRWERPGRLDFVRFGWAIIPPKQSASQ
ncbi:MAG: glycosyltransferase family 39 protein [Xanthobacteraceae bacterium]